MGWTVKVEDERGMVPVVQSFYTGGMKQAEPHSDMELPCVGPCEALVTFNYRELLVEAGMPDALNGLSGRQIDLGLFTEISTIEDKLEQMCHGRQPSGNYWDGTDPHNVFSLVRWLRESSEELLTREGNFTFIILK